MKKIIVILLVLMLSANMLVMFAGNMCGKADVARQGGPYYHQIYSATSTNGINWTVNTTMLFDHASVPGAVYFNNKLYVYYVNAEDPDNEKLSVGISEDKGITFIVHDVQISGSNSPYPVDPNPIVDDNKILLTYLGNFMQGETNKIVTATSSDGINFTEDGVIFTEENVFDPDLFYDDVGSQWVLFVSRGGVPPSMIKATSPSPNATFTKDTSFNWTAGGMASTHKIGGKYYTYYAAGIVGISVAEYSNGILSNIADGIVNFQGMSADPTVAVFGPNDYKMFFKTMVDGGTQEDQITVNFTGSTYKSVTEKPSGWFTSGQNADIMLSGIDFNNTGGPLLFNHPTGIVSDGTHLLLVDTWNNRVLIWNSLPTGNVTPNIVLGQENFYSNNPGRGLNQMNWPMGVSTDGQRVVVADTCNDRILIWNTFPSTSGQVADLVIEGDPTATYPTRRIDWPWGIWTNGVKLVVSSTSTASVLIWNSFPTQTNQSADIYLTGQGQIGTPRNIVSDGTHLIVGDHNPNVPGATGQGNFFWSSFPTANDQMPTFFMSDPGCPGGAWMRGVFTPDGKLVLLGVGLYIWNTFPASNTTPPDLTVGVWWPEPGGTKYWFHPAEGAGLTLAGNRLYTTSNNVIIGFNSLPTTEDAQPDFAVGGPDVYTNTLETNYIIQNPVPATDGTSLFVSSDSGKLYVWKYLPDESSARPDIVYTLPFAPWDSAIFENRLVLAGKDSVYIWAELPLDGELPDERLKGSIGNVTFQDLKGVELDDQYFYLSDREANKIYIWEGIPNQTTNPKFSLDIQVPTGLSSDGTYLIATATEATNSSERIKFYRIDQLSSGGQPTFLTGINVNLPQAALSVNGHLLVADTCFNRVLIWNSISDAVDGKAPDIVLGEKDFNDTRPEIGIDKLYMPAALTFDGSYLWVGEFKFSGRILRFSVKQIPHEPIYIDGNANFTLANGVIGGNGTETNPYIIEGWDIDASTAHGIYIENTDAYFIIRNCAIHDGKSNWNRGINFYNVINGKIDNVISYNNFDGIYLSDSSNNNITNCNVFYNNYDHGIALESSSNNNQITNCTVYNNYDGIYLSSSSNNQITNCAVYNNHDGIYLSSSSNNNITNCAVYNNSWYGICLDYSSNNLIYNNYFNNTANAYSSGGSGNQWNITKTLGTSIVNGAYLGGNYWGDYTGVDINGDGLGDTPYTISSGSGEQDYLPLVKAPYAVDLIQIRTMPNGGGSVVTSKSYSLAETDTFYAASYNLTVGYIGDVLVNWTCSNPSVGVISPGPGTSTTFTAISYGTCVVTASYAGKSNSTGTLTVPHPGMDMKPQMSNVSAIPNPQEAGSHVNITCIVTDDVAVNIVKVNITYPNGTTKNITMMKVGTNSYSYNTSYSVLGNYSYYIWANDTSNNQNKSGTYQFNIIALGHGVEVSVTYIGTGTINVTSAVLPQVPPENLESIGIQINVTITGELTYANITIKYRDSDVAGVDETKLRMYYWTGAEWKVCDNTGVDTVNNIVWANVTHLTIFALMAEKVDETKPVISNVQATPSTQTQGGYVNATCTVTDNIGVSIVKVSITGPTVFTPVNITMAKIAGTNNYYYNSTYSIAGTYSYYIWASDTSNNQIISAVCTFEIYTSNLPPAVVALDSPTEITANSMQLSWSQNTDSDFANYTIYQSTTSENIGIAIYTTTTQSTTSCTVMALSPSTTYYFTVVVYDTGCLCNNSNQVSGTTLTEVTTGNLTGTVTDKNSKSIEGATVSIVGTNHVTWTDSNGRYTFTGVTASSYQVRAEKSGYKTKTETGVTINAGGTTTLDIVLEEEKKAEPKGFIPGFEAVAVIIALGVVMLLRRKSL